MKYVLIVATVAALLFGLTVCGEGGDAGSEAKDHMESQSDAANSSDTIDYRHVQLTTITGEKTSLADYDGSVVLLVNVASECGFTKQYAGLEELYNAFKDSGLVVIGFPANNFGGQEPGSNSEILQFCQSRFDVTFPMMAKISVKGDDKHLLYTYLTEQSDVPGEIGWNFNKFLLGRDGKVEARFESAVEPMSDELVSKMKELL